MSLSKEFIIQGNWLFRYRSYLPITILPLLFYLISIKDITSNDTQLLIFTIIVSCFGLMIRIITVGFTPDGTSGRNTKQQIAKSLNSKGIYSLVRHPLYIGNYFMFLGPFLFTAHLWGILFFSLLFWIYYERIMYAEEIFLVGKFGKEYTVWADNTPAVIPTFHTFKSINDSISILKILFAEYSGICSIIPIFSLLLIYQNFTNDIVPFLNQKWKILLLINAFLYILLRSAKRFKRAQNNK